MVTLGRGSLSTSKSLMSSFSHFLVAVRRQQQLEGEWQQQRRASGNDWRANGNDWRANGNDGGGLVARQETGGQVAMTAG